MVVAFEGEGVGKAGKSHFFSSLFLRFRKVEMEPLTSGSIAFRISDLILPIFSSSSSSTQKEMGSV